MGKLHPDKQVWELKRRGTPPESPVGQSAFRALIYSFSKQYWHLLCAKSYGESQEQMSNKCLWKGGQRRRGGEGEIKERRKDEWMDRWTEMPLQSL